MCGMHLSCHGCERKDAFDSQLECFIDQTSAERMLADGRLLFTDKYEDVMTTSRIFPGKQLVSGQTDRLNQSFAYVDVIDVKQLG